MPWIRAGRPPRRRIATAVVVGIVVLAALPADAADTWTVEAGDIAASHALSGISCTANGWCAAVGKLGGQDGPSKLYAESASGSTWSVMPTTGPKLSRLFGASCLSPTWCQAVGWSGDGSNPLIEHWNGRAWSSVAGTAPRGQLAGVSCTSRSFCMAAGRAPGGVGALAERWNGKTWSVVPSPRKGRGTAFNGVSCVSAKWCVAVGTYTTSSPVGYTGDSLVEMWNGKVWRIAPSPALTNNASLEAVDCLSTTWCMTTGATGTGSPATGAPIEHWNGHAWKVMAPPTGQAHNGGILRGVSCASTAACVAVGDGPLSESWNGMTWKTMPAPESEQTPRFFTAVACASTAHCKAVGDGNTISVSS